MKNLINNYLNYLRVNEKSENTIKNYSVDLKQLYIYLNNNNISITAVKPQHLINFLTELDDNNKKSRGKKLSATTKARKIVAIRNFFDYLIRYEEIINKNPALEVPIPKKPKRSPKFLSLKESVSLLKNIRGTHKIRDRAIIILFLYTGLRLSELININLSDIKNNILTIIGKGNKERQIPLNDICTNAINEYLKVRPKVRSKKLFISQKKTGFTARGIQKIIKKHMDKANIDTKKYSTHDLRHTAATYIYHASKDIRVLQEILGHSNISTTQIYTHIDQDSKLKAIKSNPLNQIDLI